VKPTFYSKPFEPIIVLNDIEE